MQDYRSQQDQLAEVSNDFFYFNSNNLLICKYITLCNSGIVYENSLPAFAWLQEEFYQLYVDDRFPFNRKSLSRLIPILSRHYGFFFC